MRHRLIGSGIALALLAGLGGAMPALAEIVPHKAGYKASVRRVANIDGSGSLHVSLARRCDRWDQAETMTLTLTAGQRVTAVIRSTLQAQEAVNGSTVSWRSQVEAGGRQQRSEGKGRRAAPGRKGEVELALDGTPHRLALADDVHFRIAGIARLLQALRAGEKEVLVRSFDSMGMQAEIVEDRYVVIDSPFVNRVLPGDKTGLLAGQPWTVRTSVTVDGQPVVSVLEIYPSGVMGRIVQNTRGISVLFTLQTLETLPVISC